MNSGDIRSALRARFAAPEWAIFFEVGDGTGAVQRRWADAVAMNLWPSRGLSLQGFEIKVTRSDWRAELKNPAKAESVGQYCDYWWIVAPAGVVPHDELPETWGLYEVNPAGKITQAVAAEKRQSQPFGRPFLAALLRRAGQVDDEDIRKAVMAESAKIRDQFKKGYERDLESSTRHYRDVQARLTEIKTLTGIDLLHWTPTDEIAAAIKFVISVGAFDSYCGVDRIRNSLRHALDTLDKAVEETESQRKAAGVVEAVS